MPPAGRCPSPQVTALLLEPTWQQWAADTQAVGGALPGALEAPLQAAQQLLVTFERWLLQLKALRRMVMFGFPSDARSLAQVRRARALPRAWGNKVDSATVAGCCACPSLASHAAPSGAQRVSRKASKHSFD